MSKETANNKVLKEEKTVIPENKKTVKTEPVPKSEDPKMGVARFLQLHPQDYMIESLLKDLYGQEIMTESEWLKTLDDLLNTKITE